MKILIATGIFKPELGGPATLSLELAKRLSATGHSVTVLTYSDKAEYPLDRDLSFPVIRIIRSENKLKNYYRYFRAAYSEMKKHAVTYSLDWFSAGFPLMLAARFAGKKYIVRVGGGYIWEKYLAEGNPPVTLKKFYAEGLYKQYRFMFLIISKVLQSAERVVFNSEEQRLLYIEAYKLHPAKTLTIQNAVPENRLSTLVQSYNSNGFDRDKEIVFAGRFIKMKNIESLIEAFARIKDPLFRLLLIGEGPLESVLRAQVKNLHLENKVQFLGPMSQSDLYRRIAHCYTVVIPSWTDVSPNQAYECLALGIPFLLTKENYLSINSKKFLKIDPASVENIADTLNKILDPKEYAEFVLGLKQISFDHSWHDVVGEHLKLFISVTRTNHHDRP